MELKSFGFAVEYDVQALSGVPDTDLVHRFRREGRPPPPGHLILETGSGDSSDFVVAVTPLASRPWIGCFERGPGGISGLFATPSADTLCVVVQGQGYWVPVLDPTNFEMIRSVPIKEAFAIPEIELLVFVDFIRLSGYGPEGCRWHTDSLSWDGLEITEVTTQSIRGLAWDSPAGQDVEFVVDVENGSHKGGSSSEGYGLSG